MTTYRRRGHYRRGPNGQRVWVASHTVTRSRRQQYPYRASNSKSPRTRVVAPKAPPPWSIRWAKPNGRCPVCGAPVYFYANEFGSRVYFDEIGPPWPKHPCTVSSDAQGTGATRGRRIAPLIYSPTKGRRKLAAAHRSDRNPQLQPSSRPRTSTTSQPFTLRMALHGTGGTRLHLQRLFEASVPEVWESTENVSLQPDQVVFVDEGHLSCMDLDRMELVRFPVHINSTAPGISQAFDQQGRQPALQADSNAGCGGCLLVIAIPMLVWLLVSIWNPVNHNSNGIGAAVFLFLVAAGCFVSGVRLITRARQLRRNDENSG